MSEHNTITGAEPEGVVQAEKVPVVVLTMKLTPENAIEVETWIRARGGAATADAQLVHIQTLEGTMTARPGWWVIMGVKGEFYPCDPEVFAETYRVLGDGAIEGEVVDDVVEEQA